MSVFRQERKLSYGSALPLMRVWTIHRVVLGGVVELHRLITVSALSSLSPLLSSSPSPLAPLGQLHHGEMRDARSGEMYTERH